MARKELRNDMTLAVLGEVVRVLEKYGHLRCVPRIIDDDVLPTLTIEFHADDVEQAMTRLELISDLQYVVDAAQVRGFVERYGIDAAALKDFLPTRKVES